ncbi:MAG: XRE family transcriptional regulator [Pseudomonadota bacterium]
MPQCRWIPSNKLRGARGIGSETAERAETSDNQEPLGHRLRERRLERGLTLKAVADGAGLSVGFISQVERGLTAPSLSSLVSIARVLDTHVTQFLSQPRGESPLTRKDQRPVYAVDQNTIQYERLSASFPGSMLNGVIIHEPPGHRSEPIHHEGEEFFFVLEGAITVELEDQRTVLEAGDSIHFASTRQHSTWNHTTKPAAILHICTMDVFGDDQAPGRASPMRHENGIIGK